jgi:hypothetical protein
MYLRGKNREFANFFNYLPPNTLHHIPTPENKEFSTQSRKSLQSWKGASAPLTI